jgi:Rrf2 family transcriptional regulator, iron-sulfur cluster assembly transcription factor
MKITSSTEYATRLMVALARAHGQAALSAERLSESENVPADYVNQLLLRLKRAGLAESHRGSGGGYCLSLPPEQIALGQILRAVEGSIFEDVCGKYTDGNKDCRHQGGCAISPVWQKLGELIERYFDSITLAQLLETSPESCGKAEMMLSRIPLPKS